MSVSVASWIFLSRKLRKIVTVEYLSSRVSSDISFASIAKVGRIIVTGQILPLPSLSWPKPLMSQPFAVLHPRCVYNSSLFYYRFTAIYYYIVQTISYSYIVLSFIGISSLQNTCSYSTRLFIQIFLLYYAFDSRLAFIRSSYISYSQCFTKDEWNLAQSCPLMQNLIKGFSLFR